MKHKNLFKCILCGENSFNPVRRYKRQSGIFRNTMVVQCEDCSLLQAHPVPSEKDLFKFYVNEYREPGAIGFSESDLPIRQESQVSFIKSELEKLKFTPLNILDIGAGHGQLIIALGKTYPAADLYATELDEVCCLKLRSCGIQTQQVLLDQGDMPPFDAKFDLIVSSHVLEHARNPHKFLGRISSMLKEGGVAMIEVPNCGVPYDYGIDSPHLSFFTEHSIVIALQQSKLELLDLMIGGISASEYLEPQTKSNLLKNFIFACLADSAFLNDIFTIFKKLYRVLLPQKIRSDQFLEKEKLLEDKYRNFFYNKSSDGTFLRIFAVKSNKG
jgi:2-polyprenyl-3-methyl-5-hydroxy-6-metoxy-1,4-benzoquinol methylase